MFIFRKYLNVDHELFGNIKATIELHFLYLVKLMPLVIVLDGLQIDNGKQYKVLSRSTRLAPRCMDVQRFGAPRRSVAPCYAWHMEEPAIWTHSYAWRMKEH